ncbi:CHAT domain-containing protein [Microcoleus sp. B3-D7]|uniref:CHAT domain-containing protein n=1 Tax=Microcoleus sp. B3-D7 TaxID=2818659 RepID=UPI003B187485
MFDRTQWFLAGMSIALSVQLSQPVVAAVPVGKVVQTAQSNSSEAAEKALKEGLQLYQQGTAQAKRSAIVKYEEALKLYRAVGDAQGEARTLNNIGAVYSDLGEKQKALEYYSQSLPLFRAVGDRGGEAVTLNNTGTVYSDLGEKQKALEYYSQSLPLRRAIGDRSGEAATLTNIGTVYSALGEKQKALEYYSQSLPVFRAVGNRRIEAVTLNRIGLVYSDLGEKQKALEYYNQSLPLSRATGDRIGEATTLNSIGKVYSDLGEKQKALEYYSQSLPLSRATGDRREQAVTLNNIGGVYSDLGENLKALEYYSQSLPLFRAIGDRGGEATTLHNIGSVYSYLGEQQKALEYYSQSLPLRRATGDRSGEATTLNNIGGVYYELGEKQKALEYYSQSLPLSRATGDRSGEALTLNNIGLVYSDLGEKQKALEYYSQSLPLRRAIGDRRGEATTLINIGAVYSDLGERQKAVEYYSQSLPLFRAVGDRRGEAGTLNNIGLVYSQLGEKQKALEYYSQSLPLRRATGDRSGEVTTLNNIGTVYLQLGEQQKGLEYYSQSLPLSRAIGDRSGEALTLNNIGSVYSDLGEKQKGLEYYSQSLPLRRAVGDRGGEANTLYGIAYVKRHLGNLTEALKNIESSLKIIENLRTKIASPELRSSYFATVQNYYEFYIDLLMQLHKTNPKSGYDTKALEASERSRARSLLELLFESNANIREGIDPDLLQQEKSLQQQLDAIEKQRIEAISIPNPNATKIAEIDSGRLALLEQYQQIQAKIRTASPRYAALTQPQPLTLPEIQKQILDENTILLQYSLGEYRSYLWVVTSTGLTSYELPKRADIETVARNFRDTVTSQIQRDIPQQVAQASANLGQVILQPAAAQLGNKRLLIVPDGVLHYTPFPALTLPQTRGQNTNVPLIAEHEIITLPSVSSLAILRQNYGDRKSPNQTLAILADPVFSPDDERIKGKITQEMTDKLEANNLGLNRSLRASEIEWPPQRLPFTRQEAQTISSLFPSASSRQIFDFDASRTTATDGNLVNYQIIHLATHGLANSKNPELSGIVMSMVDDKGNLVNGFLRLTDIFNLKLAANLVVLSACKTGMGQNVKGEGMVGLTRGFMYAGAQRVAVSLWSVDDEGTAVLMQKFYQKMVQQKLAPAAALRAAQIEMMQEEKWKSPYYWAAFTLQGEWK